jgi:predicted dehydrogenase
MVGYTFVYSSAARKIKELVLSRDLGKVQYYDSVRVNLGIGRHGVSVLADLAVHDLAILRYTLPSAPIAISANGVRFDHDAPESMAHVTTYLDDGAVAHLNVNWLAPVKTRRVTIGGTQKLLLWDDLEQSEKIKVYHCRPILMGDPVELREALIDYRIGDMWAPHLAPTEPLMNEVAHFRDCVMGNSTPITNGHFGLQIVDLIDAARLSMQQRGRPIELSAHCSARAALVASGG